MASDRVHKTMMNAKVGVIFYFISIFMAFFSRRIFLQSFGDDFIGLAGTLWSILEFLNISEIGIGTCIGYFLYKPIEENNRDKMCEIVSLFGYLYRIIGTIILVGGLIVSLSFPLVFADKGLPYSLVFFTFYGFLTSQLLGYFINYRQILLDSDQKTYKISIWTQSGGVLKTIAQIWLAYNYQNPYIWVAVDVVFSLIICWVLNRVIYREYPWLKTDKSRGKEILKKYPEILIKAKQIVIHRLKDFFLTKSDQILIFAFESLQMVTFYGNYTMIVGKLMGLFNSVLAGMNASIGNLVAEGNTWNIRKVFWEYATFRYWTTGVIVISLTFLFDPIISWWVGPQYVMKDYLVWLILLNMYITLTRPSVDLFINAYGLYDDVWAAYAEGIINLVITIIMGYFYGLLGILLGKTVSMLVIVVIWKPYYLFSKGLKYSIFIYWRNILTHIGILLCALAINKLIVRTLEWQPDGSILYILTYASCVTLPVIIIYSSAVFLLCPGAHDLINRLPFIHRK